MMTREDLLRELELLPVWQLRDAVQKINANLDVKPVEAAAIAQPTTVAPETQVTQSTPIAEPLPSFRMLVSTDDGWVFLLEHKQNAEAEQLLQNMLKAVAVNPNQDVANANTQHINQCAPKVIVVMGEPEAQQLLAVTQTLDALRGQQHQYKKVPVIVTYSPTHLLTHLADKAKAWEDLCLAKLTIAFL